MLRVPKEKFHAKARITHARLDVVGSSALVGSANFTYPGATENIELSVCRLPCCKNGTSNTGLQPKT